MLSVRTRGPWLSLVASVLVSLVMAVPAFAGNAYFWETEEGTYSYTDDPKRIPARYKDVAKLRTLKKLDDYPRLTPGRQYADGDYLDRMAERLAQLRSRQVETGEACYGCGRGQGRGHGPGGAVARMRTSRRNGLDLEFSSRMDRRGAGPLIQEEVRVMSDTGDATNLLRVVRRGDEVIAIQRGEENNLVDVSYPREEEWRRRNLRR